MMNISKMIEVAEYHIKTVVNDTALCVQFKGKEIGLDQVYGTLYIERSTGDLIVGRLTDTNLRYYGGLDHVQDHHVNRVGNWVVYSGAADRVEQLVDMYVPAENN